MSNDYFQFKQFRVGQERCAMKVTTDACIQGAWTPVLPHVKRVLDIGAGTGLLSLMLAQRKDDIAIDAIEIDKDAARQAKENAAASSWKDRVNVIDGDVRNYPFPDKYDLIVANPPFFNNSLLSNGAAKGIARHTLHLSFSQLLDAVSGNLAADGYVSILLPDAENRVWKGLAQQAGFFEVDRLMVRHTEHAPVKRVVSIFSKNEPSFVGEQELCIMDAGQRYSETFIGLLSPFYLDL